MSAQSLRFTLNGQAISLEVRPIERLATVLRREAGLTGTKIGRASCRERV